MTFSTHDVNSEESEATKGGVRVHNDPLWPRFGELFERSGPAELTVLGVPAWRTSISPTGAYATPDAVREAMLRYSTYSISHNFDLASMRFVDAGDVVDPDGEEGEARTWDAVVSLGAEAGLLVAIGGDNSITFAVMRAVMGDELSTAGLVTLDAHYDLRDGVSNGSPVRRLIDAGLPGRNIVQIGISDFANSPAYAARARDAGITVISRREVERVGIESAMTRGLALAGAAGGRIYVDLDVDVCDRSVVPACPAAAPGGLSAEELRVAAFCAGRDLRVAAIDLTEIDATCDSVDGRTVRLAALSVAEAAVGRGLASR